ncbi:SPOR domain-containing protein [Duganella sp. CY15W]|uniref:SPOR domain-containing protein n=1 Tax=Duganella sp. CY15W TaxID=2692172 RepID=UPI00136E7D32|nr:SPOR domain-containing protein [Duganella sp. CY15W]MYM31056.1 SPOR domain-containing protein [Duganella sp. CY15W]
MNFRSSFTPRSQQQGNTFVGIVIGLVIGLSIAVVVALMITKGSTPFTDKGHPSKAAEPTAGQVADPNKPMYGNKDAAREAAKDFSKDQQPATAATPAPTAPAVPAAPSKPAADQLQAMVDKIQGTPAPAAKPAPAAAPNAANVAPQPAAKAAPAADTAAGDDKFIYYLQAGAFREVADAENARAKLALLGFEANISDRSTDTGVLHRVRLGPYNQVETMNKVRGKLSENGIDVAVVRNQK